MTAPLSEALLSSAPAAWRTAGELEPRLEALVAALRAARPGFDVDAAAFLAHCGARLPPGSSLDPSPALVDLYLAFACLQRIEPAAVEVRERARLQASFAARRLRLPAAEADDLSQQTLAVVLVGDGVPRLTHYSGQGVLDAWLAATAFRIGLRELSKQRRQASPGAAEAATPSWEHADPELDFIKQRYREHFATAFRQALEKLSAREKSVLKLHLFGGLNIERIGACYGVHRATVARWIASAREKLLFDTRSALAQRLGLGEAEVDSLVGLLKSQVEVSLANYLVTSGG